MAGKPPVAGFNKNPQNINRKGQPPKGYSITAMMKEMLEAQPDLKRAIGQSIAKKALQGDITAVKTLWGYMDGLPSQPIEQTGEVTIRISHE